MDVELDGAAAYESTELVEAAHLREALMDIFAIDEPFEGDNATAVLQRQQEVVWNSDVNWFELGEVGGVQCADGKLHVCECQLAKRHRIANAWTRVERGESVAEHG